MRLGINGRFLTAPETGVQRFSGQLLAALADRVEPVLFVPSDAPADHPAIPAGIRVVRGKLPGRSWEQLELPGVAGPSGHVLLHPANSGCLWGGPHVQVLHDVFPLTRPAEYTRAYRAWVRVAHVAAARRAAAVVTVSSASAQAISGRLGIPGERIVVALQGAAPLDAPASPDAVDAVLGRLDLARPYVLAVGTDARKGVDVLVEAWRGWPRGERRPLLVFVGVQDRAVHAALPPRPAADAMRWVGRVSDDTLRALYTGALALVHPARNEGFGRPPLEALACGTRVLAGPYAAAREVLGQAADIVSWDPAAWRKAVERVLDESPGDRAARVEAGRRHASTFTWARTADVVLELCRRVAEEAAS